MARRETIQSFIESGDTWTAYCHNHRCRHHQVLDMRKLLEKLGPEHGALHDDLVPKLYCSKCGGKQVGLIRSPRGNDKRVPARGFNTYAVTKNGR